MNSRRVWIGNFLACFFCFFSITNAFGQSGIPGNTVPLLTLSDLDKKIVEVKQFAQDTKSDQFALNGHLGTLLQLSDRVRAEKTAVSEAVKATSRLTELQISARSTVSEIRALPCSTNPATTKQLSERMSTITTDVQGLRDTWDPNKVVTNPLSAGAYLWDRPTPNPASCMSFKAVFVGNFLDDFNKMIDGLKAEIANPFGDLAARAAKLEELSKEIDDAVPAVRTRLDKTSTPSIVANNLLIILGLFFTFSLAHLISPKFLPKEILVEWVRSGQSLQSITIVLLLIAILVLGMSDILKENTLGTLLGGVSGYVLAKGIGQAGSGKKETQVTPQSDASSNGKTL